MQLKVFLDLGEEVFTSRYVSRPKFYQNFGFSIKEYSN